MNDRQQRISLLSRINRGKQLLPSLTIDLAEALRIPVSSDAFLSLPETDLLWQAGASSHQVAGREDIPSFRRFYSRHQSHIVFEIANRLAIAFARTEETGVLLLRQSEFCGAVKVPIAAALASTRALLNLDGDTLRLRSMDQRESIEIDWNPDDLDENFELSTSGNRWPLIVLAEIDQLSNHR